ncbi:MAG: neutral/alkaline non-lysosomal ceramidase N-terminal domain-containing protein [Planctomycetota bacterium]
MAGLNIGVARTDITPPVGVQLCGYTLRASTSVDHPLRAEALVCEGEDGAWALVTADLLAVSRPLVATVRQAVATRTPLAPDSILVAATHTHSGPRAYAVGWSERPEETDYLRTLEERLADLVVQAWDDRRAGEWVVGHAEVRDLASNRRVRDASGAWTNEWADPDGRHPGPVDPTADLLGVRRADGTLDALLVTYGRHPVGFGAKSTCISGDYPSYLKDALEASGEVGAALFAVSGHADVDPRVCVQADPAPVRETGRRLAEAVRDALPGLAPVPAGPVRAVREPWTIPLAWSLSEHSRSYFPVHETGETLVTEVQALGAGDLCLIGLPGEAVNAYRARIRDASPFAETLLLSVANDFVGYLVTDAILEEGAYEAGMSPLRPAEADILGTATATLQRLRAAMPDAQQAT